MQATRSNAFAFKKSGLDAFLYADVGIEANGSTLTIISILARLGKDPWAQAATWAALPKAAVIDSLAESIALMPLAPSALAGAHQIAAQLVQLLPKTAQGFRQGSAAKSETATPKWLPTMLLCCAFAAGMALTAILMPGTPSGVPAPIEQSTGAPSSNRPAARTLLEEAASAGSQAVLGRR